MLIDYHIHTKRCGHAEGETEDYVKAAIEKGLEEIGFSDHFPLFHIDAKGLSMGMHEIPAYMREIENLKEKYRDKISIKIAMEVEYNIQIEEKTREILQNHKFDYLLGGCHMMGDWLFDHPDHIEGWNEKDIFQVYKDYFELMESMARSKLFDIIAHADLVKKFGHKPKNGISDLYKKVITEIKKSDMCVEINTSGLRKPVKEIYPSEEFVKICFEMNVPVTMGSDAHKPGDVAWEFNRGIELLKKTGYRKIAAFNKRKRSFVNI